MLADKFVRDELNKFAKYVIQQSRSNLTKGSQPYGSYNDTKSLYNSLDYDLDPTAKGFSLSFKMEDYGKFKDKGVRGKSSSARAPKSPYRFGTGSGKKGGLRNSMEKYVRRKKIQFRDRKTGRFLSYESTAYLISRSIYQKGLKSNTIQVYTTIFKKDS